MCTDSASGVWKMTIMSSCSNSYKLACRTGRASVCTSQPPEGLPLNGGRQCQVLRLRRLWPMSGACRLFVRYNIQGEQTGQWSRFSDKVSPLAWRWEIGHCKGRLSRDGGKQPCFEVQWPGCLVCSWCFTGGSDPAVSQSSPPHMMDLGDRALVLMQFTRLAPAKPGTIVRLHVFM